MSHEPECLHTADYPECMWCVALRAAYERGIREGAEVGIRNGESIGYTRGYQRGYEYGYNSNDTAYMDGYQRGYLARLQEEYVLDEGNPYNEAQRHALSDAAKRVGALLDQGDCPECSYTSRDQEIIAAIMGEI